MDPSESRTAPSTSAAGRLPSRAPCVGAASAEASEPAAPLGRGANDRAESLQDRRAPVDADHRVVVADLQAAGEEGPGRPLERRCVGAKRRAPRVVREGARDEEVVARDGDALGSRVRLARRVPVTPPVPGPGVEQDAGDRRDRSATRAARPRSAPARRSSRARTRSTPPAEKCLQRLWPGIARTSGYAARVVRTTRSAISSSRVSSSRPVLELPGTASA